jgi:adenosylcobinamide-phosphate synthase
MPLNTGCQVFLAYLLDLALGEPRRLPHPVMLMGKAIEILERLMRLVAKSPAMLRGAGAVTASVVVGGSWLLTFFILHWSYSLSHWLGTALSIWLIYTTMATRGLADAAGEVYSALKNGELPEARRKVGWIVGRDTNSMDSRNVTRATVETVAENIVDGIISPMFYALIGGAPLAMAYRAVNTLDSMLGYKNERYIDFGKASAHLDDLVNYVPARLTGLLILAAAFLLRMSPKRALAAILRDSRSHPSPNSGIPEAAVAGSLGVRLGGLNYYHGRESFRAYMGEDLVSLKPNHIRQTIKLMYLTSVLMTVAGLFIYLTINYFLTGNFKS